MNWYLLWAVAGSVATIVVVVAATHEAHQQQAEIMRLHAQVQRQQAQIVALETTHEESQAALAVHHAAEAARAESTPAPQVYHDTVGGWHQIVTWRGHAPAPVHAEDYQCRN